MKPYTVNFKKKDDNGNIKQTFDSLLLARQFAKDLYRKDNFKSLANAKGVLLTI